MTPKALVSAALKGNHTAVADESQHIPRAEDYRALSDRECILLARKGRRSGMGELVHRYTDGVYQLQLRLLGDRDLAADATQEVFLRAQRSLDRFDTSSRFRPWLFSIAWNLGRDVLRARKRRGETRWLSIGRTEDNGKGRQGVDPIDPGGATPSEILEGKEDRELVLRALEKLRLQDRALLVLREFEGLSYQELSALFGYRMGTVKSSLNRARHRLKDALLTLCPDFSKN